ncbi:MAG: alkaline phosphatase family protein [Steroidobacteraceae bacterium]|jgi:phosphatidylinositol-3-phosphatase
MALGGFGGVAVHAASERAVPRYDHIFLIIEENRSYAEIIGAQSIAPNINRLAKEYGQATRFYAEVHPSEGNYVAMLGGDTFGIHDDDAYYCKPGMQDAWCPKSKNADYVNHTVSVASLVDQLEDHGLTWKAYMESIPEPGSGAVRWPTLENPVRGIPAELYAVKHNGFMSFQRVQNDPHRSAKIVGFDALERDLTSGNLPNYAHIVPNQCNDMHGRDQGPDIPADCNKSNPEDLIKRGDRVAGELVASIMRSPIWSAPGNVAIVITFDENGKAERNAEAQGCCGYDPASRANFGGGRIPTVVITNHGVRGVLDATPYNHYSLLRTTESAFGIDGRLANAGNIAAGVTDMSALFAVH